MTLAKEDLLKQMFGIQEVELQRGGTVKVRGLTRAEAHTVKDKKMTEEESEQFVLSLAVVEPKLSKDDVRAWQENSPAGEIQDVYEAIVRLSGMEKAAAKAAYNDFRE